MSVVSANLAIVRRNVAEAAARVGREVQLLVVSKTWPADVVGEAVQAGQLLFGENRLQEGEEKIPRLPDDLEWHFIGTLQRNKVRRVLSLFQVVQSLSSLKLVRFADRVAGELGIRPKVFLEVNIGEEESKHGFAPDELREGLDEILSSGCLNLQGLMCIPPRVKSAEEARPWFARVRELQEELEGRAGQSFPEISMGMSSDYEVAIEEGATIVRVGSAIFGPRLKQEMP